MEVVKDLLKTSKDDKEKKICRNILLETFDNIRDDLRRGEHLFAIKVRIVCGRQIQGRNISPKVCIIFRKQKRWTQRETISTNEPYWGETFHFNCVTDVESLLRENVTFSVVNSRMLRRNLVIGEFQLSLVLVAGENKRSMFNRWLALVDPSEPTTVCKGFLKVCVALVFPNEAEVRWPEPLAYNSTREDVQNAILTCSGHTFLKMTFIMSLYLIQDLPKHDMKGRKVWEVIVGLSFAGKAVKSDPISLQEDTSEPFHVQKQLHLTVSWPSMCNILNLTLYSVNGKEEQPLCCHSFQIREISVENSSSLKRDVRSEAPVSDANFYAVDSSTKLEDKKSGAGKEYSKQVSKSKLKGYMPMIGPCFVNLYGAPLDTFEDKVEPSYITKMNSGDIEGCAYRGRMFVRLRSEFCDASGDNTCVKDLNIGSKEQKSLTTFAKSTSFLLFGMINSVPMVSDANSMIQFELSIGHNGINNMVLTTGAQLFPSLSFGINPKEILKSQRAHCGHSYSTLPLDNEKPAFLIESSWEDIRYRLHFYNYIGSLRRKFEKQMQLIVMSYKLGLSRERIVVIIHSLCYDMEQCMKQTPIPTGSPAEAAMNDMDNQWVTMRCQQLEHIKNEFKSIMDYAQPIVGKSNIANKSKVANKGEASNEGEAFSKFEAAKKAEAADKSEAINKSELAKAARILCERLTGIALLFENINKEPQLSIPDIFIYMLVNNERRAYARLPAASIYYCHEKYKTGTDYTRYRGAMANKFETVFLKIIPGLRGINEDEYWPIPGMIRLRLLFGVTSNLRSVGVLPPMNYYGVIYEYTKLSNYSETACSGQKSGDSKIFKTDSSGINIVEPSCSLLKANPTSDHESSYSKWHWSGEWTPWRDTSILTNSTAETVLDFVYQVHMREKMQEKGKSTTTWSFLGYFTEDMKKLEFDGNTLDPNFALDASKWTVVLEKGTSQQGEEVAWVEVKDFEEYSRDIKFDAKDVTSTARLNSNFARKLLQRKRRCRDMIYTETLSIKFLRSTGRWVPTDISRFDGVKKVVIVKNVRSWTQLQSLRPLSSEVVVEVEHVNASGEENTMSHRANLSRKLNFYWIDDWQELLVPTMSKDGRSLDVKFERRKMVSNMKANSMGDWEDATAANQEWCNEFGSSLTDCVFHISQQKGEKVKRTRIRRLLEPSEVSLSLKTTVGDQTIKIAPFPTFIVQRRVSKRSLLSCLFSNVEHIPTTTTVIAVVNTAHICRWEMRCYLHEARDLLIAENKDQLYVYAVISIAGMSSVSSIVQNDFNTQLWRWNETIIFRNLLFHEDADQVAASPPVVVIEFFLKLPIRSDLFLGRCIVDSENFVVKKEHSQLPDENVVLQWQRIHLKGTEDVGRVLLGFHFRHRDTFWPPFKVFKDSFLTPPEKNMAEDRDRVVLDGRKRFEIPEEILPILVPHVLKITSWGLRQLRNYMLSRVSNPTIEFRIGHNVLQTESLNYQKSPNFQKKCHSLQIYLPVEVSYLPDLHLVVRDSRAFGRAPLVGVTKIPLNVCRYKDAAHMEELELREVNYFSAAVSGNLEPTSQLECIPYERLEIPIRINLSREFFYLFEPPPSQIFRNLIRSDKNDRGVSKNGVSPVTIGERMKSTIFKILLLRDEPRLSMERRVSKSDYKLVLGDETLSKAKPDWWCKYYLSKTSTLTKAVNYLEGDRLEFYHTMLEETTVRIGDSDSHHLGGRFKKICEILRRKVTEVVDDLHKPVVEEDIQESETERLHQVSYRGFNDVFDFLDLQRTKQLTSDEENRKFGTFLGKVRLYYLGANTGKSKLKQSLDDLNKTKAGKRYHSYAPLYSCFPNEMSNQDCLVRVYIVRALELQAGNMASLPNSYVEVFTSDNKKESQLRSSKSHSIEMDSNPIYGQMFELYCIIPFQTRLRVRVMDKSGLLFDEEIGSTTIDLEKRMTTAYRATCGLPQCYRQSGINTWRDIQKPSEILNHVCQRFGLGEPYYWTESDADDDMSSNSRLDDLKLLHRYHLFPPGCTRESYMPSKKRSSFNHPIGNIEVKHQPSSFEVVEFLLPPPLPQPENLIPSDAMKKVLKKGQDEVNKKKTVMFDESSSDIDEDSSSETVERKLVEVVDSPKPSPKPTIFRLEDFDAINENAGIHLGPNDNEPSICRERLALNILRRLPLVREHVETRSLHNPLQPDMAQGRLEMWVDIFSLGDFQKEHCGITSRNDGKRLKAEEMILKVRDLLPPPVDVSPREPQPYELRVVVWSVHEVISETDYGGSSSGDLYVRAWMEGLGDTQETDVHYDSLYGEGEFNWRFVFQLDYLPHERAICGKQKVGLFSRVLTKIPPMLHLQLWDNRRFRFDDFIGSVELNLSKLTSPARTKDHCFMRQRWAMDLGLIREQEAGAGILGAQNSTDETVNLFEVQRVYGYWPLGTSRSHEFGDSQSGAWMVGKILMELEILSKEEAALKSAGLGRGEPNQNPILPNPKRLSIGNNFCATSISAFRKLFWNKYKWHCIGALLMTAFISLFILTVVSVPLTIVTGSERPPGIV